MKYYLPRIECPTRHPFKNQQMRTRKTSPNRLPYLILAIGFALAIGLGIPAFYEWTKGSQIYGRELKLLHATVQTLALTVVASAICLWWKRQRQKTGTASPQIGGVQDSGQLAPIPKIQFSIRGLLIVTTFAAVLITTSRIAPITWYGIISLGLILGILCSLFFVQRLSFARVLCWLCVSYLPFAWVIPFSRPFGPVSGMLVSMPTLPALIPGAFVNRSLGAHPTDVIGMFFVTVVALLVGFFVTRRSGKLSTVVIVFAFISSVCSSLLLHIGYRA